MLFVYKKIIFYLYQKLWTLEWFLYSEQVGFSMQISIILVLLCVMGNVCVEMYYDYINNIRLTTVNENNYSTTAYYLCLHINYVKNS